jgi:hypothetical protein
MKNQKSVKRLTLDVFKEKSLLSTNDLAQNGGAASLTSSLCPSIVTIIIRSGADPASCSSNDCHP